MAQNIKEIMIALNNVLTTCVWVNSERQIVSLADELHSFASEGGAPKSIEDLSRPALIGAYVSLQIRTDNFDTPAEALSTSELALKVKTLVFAEAKRLMEVPSTSKASKAA